MPMQRLLIGADPVLLDSYGAGLIGLSPSDVDYIRHGGGFGRGQAVYRRRAGRTQPCRTGRAELFIEFALHNAFKKRPAEPSVLRVPGRAGARAQPYGARRYAAQCGSSRFASARGTAAHPLRGLASAVAAAACPPMCRAARPAPRICWTFCRSMPGERGIQAASVDACRHRRHFLFRPPC